MATQIQEAAALLRRQQKGLLDKLQDLNTTGSTDLDTNEPNEVFFCIGRRYWWEYVVFGRFAGYDDGWRYCKRKV